MFFWYNHFMKSLQKPKILTVFCSCGQKLVKYKKGTGRRLVKIHKDRVVKDFTDSQIFLNDLPENTDLFCPKCEERIATVKMISGKYINKLNQGKIGNIK